MSTMQWKQWYAAPVLLIVSLLAYGNIFDQKFVYDDRELVVDNPAIATLSQLPQNFASHYWAGSRSHSNLYRPMVIASLTVDHALHGLNPRGYKLTNFVLHTLCAGAVFLLGMVLIGSPLPALAAAALFAAHPLHTEAVTSIVGRTELLWTFFALVSLRCWLELPPPQDRNLRDGRQRRFLMLAILFWFLALLSKESALLLPIFFVVADVSRGITSGTTWLKRARQAWKSGWKGPFWGATGALILYLALRWRVLGFLGLGGIAMIPKLDNPLAHSDAVSRVFTAFALFARYVWQHVWPLGLSADYSFNQIPVVQSALNPATLVGIALAAALCVGSVAIVRGNGAAALLPLWIWLVPLLLASNLATPIITLYAERLTYFPSVGFVLLAALLGHAALYRFEPLRQSRAAAVCVTVVVVTLSLLSFRRNLDWTDEATFFAAMVRDAPQSARAHHNYGNQLLETGHAVEAEAEFRRALEIMPDLAAAHVNLGLLRERQGQADAAVAEYRRAAELDPRLSEAHDNLGRVLKESGRIEEAIGAFREAIRVAPDNYRARYNLANTFAAMGLLEEAVREYRQTLALRPNHAQSHFNLGNTLARQGKNAEARAAYEGFLRVWKGDADMLARAREAIAKLP